MNAKLRVAARDPISRRQYLMEVTVNEDGVTIMVPNQDADHDYHYVCVEIHDQKLVVEEVRDYDGECVIDVTPIRDLSPE